MEGRKPLLHCAIPLIVMQGYHTNIEDTGSLCYNSVCYITSRIGWVSLKGISRLDVDGVVLENCTITFVIRTLR